MFEYPTMCKFRVAPRGLTYNRVAFTFKVNSQFSFIYDAESEPERYSTTNLLKVRARFGWIRTTTGTTPRSRTEAENL
jgi:hypothetical protein